MSFVNQRLGFTRYAADEAYRRALEAMAKSDYQAAFGLMNEAIAELPRNSEYLATRGLIHYEEAEWDEARADFEAALKLHRYEVLANYGLGMLALRENRPEAALPYLKTASYTQKGKPEVAFALAVAYARTGDLVNAVNTMGQAHAQFEKTNDKRKAESAKWLREFARQGGAGSANVKGGRQALEGGELPRLPDVED